MSNTELTFKIPSWYAEDFSITLRRNYSNTKKGQCQLVAEVKNKKTNETNEIYSYEQNELQELVSDFIRAISHKARNLEFEKILSNGLLVKPSSVFEELKINNEFQISAPMGDIALQIKNTKKPQEFISKEPVYDDYKPEYTFADKIIQAKKDKKDSDAKDEFQRAYQNWLDSKMHHEAEMTKYNERILSLTEEMEKERYNWEQQKNAFYRDQDAANKLFDDIKSGYLNNSSEFVPIYIKTVLESVKNPAGIPNEIDIEYLQDSASLVIDIKLPNIDDTPEATVVNLANGRLKLKELSQANKKKSYESAIYQIIFRTLHLSFLSDSQKHIQSITVNGWVTAIDKSVGKPLTSCIISLNVLRSKFEEIDLACIDAKICFKSLHGVCASDLSAMTPISPIIQISKTDSRFVESRKVINSVDNGTNLAAMDWEDFEHLIREIFESEFSANGGEVKVTQASRDGGVDAIAFDPDPIRGGKIVIQAKRYTNTVGVSSVRDLYGTVMNEGATKGVLVTTSDFGPDSYEFAKGKPITLLNGSNLLFLLEKHGHKARIDMQEAKQYFKDNPRAKNE